MTHALASVICRGNEHEVFINNWIVIGHIFNLRKRNMRLTPRLTLHISAWQYVLSPSMKCDMRIHLILINKYVYRSMWFRFLRYVKFSPQRVWVNTELQPFQPFPRDRARIQMRLSIDCRTVQRTFLPVFPVCFCHQYWLCGGYCQQFLLKHTH